MSGSTSSTFQWVVPLWYLSRKERGLGLIKNTLDVLLITRVVHQSSPRVHRAAFYFMGFYHSTIFGMISYC